VMITRQACIGDSVDIIRHFFDRFIRESDQKVVRGPLLADLTKENLLSVW
jgi:hypothetical protein